MSFIQRPHPAAAPLRPVRRARLQTAEGYLYITHSLPGGFVLTLLCLKNRFFAIEKHHGENPIPPPPPPTAEPTHPARPLCNKNRK